MSSPEPQDAPLLLAIDGGGTKTDCRIALFDGQLRILGQGLAGPSNLRALGAGQAFANLEVAVATAFASAGLQRSTAAVACLALAGADRTSEQLQILEWAAAARLSQQLRIVNDAVPLLFAESGDGTGVALIAGTGSLAWGCNADGRTARCSRGTVSTLWFTTSGRASSTSCNDSARPRRSEMSTSMPQSGVRARMACTVAATCAAPPSVRSSRATIVITAKSNPMRSTARATRSGSPASSASGRRVSTRQKPQARVQRSPHTMNVAVPSAQHSERLGHPASSHTVTRSRSATVRLISRYRPTAEVIALTPHPATLQHMSVLAHVRPMLFRRERSLEDMLYMASEMLVVRGLAQYGDSIVFVAGVPAAMKSTTNVMKLHKIGEEVRMH
jgi:hypothetical protein